MGRPRPSKLNVDSNTNLGLSLGIGITETKAFITGSKMSGVKKKKKKNRFAATHTVHHLPTGLTYGGNKGGIKGIIRKTKKDAGLPYSRVSDQEQLEKQVVRLLRHWEERLRLSPPAAPRDRSLSLRPTPHLGVLRPEYRGSVGKTRAREGGGDLRTASSRKPRRWRRPVPPRAATAAPQPLPAAPPGSGESVGTKWPPLPLQGCSAGTLPRATEQALPSRERDGREDSLSPEQELRARTRRWQRRRTRSRRAQLHSHRKPSRPGQSHLFPVPSHAGVRAA